MKILNFILSFLLFSIGIVQASDVQWIEYEGVTALYLHPKKDKVLPAIVFNHGGVIEKMGYAKASRMGYDLEGYVRVVGDSGYACIAPIRNDVSLFSGVEAVKGAIRFLESQTNIDRNNIAIIGYSKGGIIACQSVIDGINAKAVVLMSPAGIDMDINSLKGKLQSIKIPVFLTLGDKREDPNSINFCYKILIPELEGSNKSFEYIKDYPGDHKWFWVVRPRHWKDVVRFLDKYLK